MPSEVPLPPGLLCHVVLPLDRSVLGDHLRVPGFRLALEDVAEALPRTCLDGLTRRCLVLCADAVEMLLPDVLRVIVIGKSGTLELYISTSSLETGKSMYCIDLNVDG